MPKSDLFEVIEIPDMCLHQNKCLPTKSNGCYLSLIKRKKVTRLDSKQLIIMAENRKLFGDLKLRKNRVRTGKSLKKQNSVKVQSAKPKEKRSNDIILLVDIGFPHYVSCFVLSLLLVTVIFRLNVYHSIHIHRYCDV